MQKAFDFLPQRKLELDERISAAVSVSGRSTDDIRVLAVSKTVDTDGVRAAHRAGYSLFGENRPQELALKLSELEQEEEYASLEWHMIGNLQTNKINQVLTRASLIHSVSSAHLAHAIDKRARAKELVQPVLLEVNVSGEASKSGFSVDELLSSLDELMELEALSIEGLMTMAPAGDVSGTRAAFAGLYSLAEELRVRTGLALSTLSYGMSDDFEIALEEGSNLLRLGRCIFDEHYFD